MTRIASTPAATRPLPPPPAPPVRPTQTEVPLRPLAGDVLSVSLPRGRSEAPLIPLVRTEAPPAAKASHHELADLAAKLNPIDPHSLVGEYVALPTAPSETAQYLTRITRDLMDGGLDRPEHVQEVRKQTQAVGKLLFSVTTLPAAVNAAGAMIPASSGLYVAAKRLGQSHGNRFMNDVMSVARPIGDTALLIGDGLYLRHVLQDPQATKGQIGRAVLDVGLDTARVVSYALPKTAVVAAVADAALWARFGLGIYDMATG